MLLWTALARKRVVPAVPSTSLDRLMEGSVRVVLVGQTSRRRFLVGFPVNQNVVSISVLKKKNILALLFTTYVYLPCQNHHDFEDPKHIKLRFLNPHVFRLIARPTWCGLGWTRQTSWAKKLKIDNLISVTPSAA